MANIWEDLKDIKIDFTGHDFSEDIEKLLSGTDEAKINAIAHKLQDIRNRITKKEQVLATVIEVLKFLKDVGLEVIK